jgi:hypothetical protein
LKINENYAELANNVVLNAKRTLFAFSNSPAPLDVHVEEKGRK